MNNKILAMAGIAAAQKWDIDLAKVNITIVNNLEPFKVRKPLLQAASAPLQKSVPMPPSDDIIFEEYNETQWRVNGFEFWLAWGPITDTLAIHIKKESGKR